MKTKILMALALFFMLSGFNGEDRIVEENGVNLQTSVDFDLERPTIIERPKVLVTDGSEIILQVRFLSEVKPSITWHHYSELVKEDKRHEILLSRDETGVMTTMLVIKNPTAGDYGIYKVLITNAAGECGAKIELSLEGEENI